jgi:hypothetical protein
VIVISVIVAMAEQNIKNNPTDYNFNIFVIVFKKEN